MSQKRLVKSSHILIWFIALIFYTVYIAPVPATAISNQADGVTKGEKETSMISLTTEEKLWLKTHSDIRLGAPTTYPPLVVKNAKGPHTGMLIDLFEVISQRLNINIRLHIEDSWPSILEKAKNRNIDGLATGGRSASRKEYLNPTDTLYSTYHYIFARTNDRLQLKSVKDLKGMHIGYKKADTPVKSLLDKYDGVTPVPYNNNVAMTKGLMNKEVDVLVAWISYDFWRRDKLQGAVENILLATDNPLDMYIHIRNDWPELIPILNKVLSSIRQNELPKIMDKWFIVRPRLPETSKIHLTKKEQAWLAKNKTIRVRVTDYPPYIIPKKEGEPVGIAIDYLKLIAERTGVEFEYNSSGKTFLQALNGLIDHKGPDLLSIIVATTDRKKSIIFTNEYFNSPYMIFIRADNKQIITHIDDLIETKIALLRGAALHEMMKRDYSDFSLILYDTDIEAIEAVASGEADAYMGNLMLASYLILNKGTYNLKIAAPGPFDNQRFSMGVRNDWPELAGIIDKGLATITTKEQDEIRNRYISIHYDKIDTAIIVKWILIVLASASIIILIFIFINRSLKKQVAERTSELKSSEEQYRYLFENMAQGVFYQSIDGELKGVNSAALEMFGLSYDQFIGKTSKDPQWRVVHEDGTDFQGEDHPSMVALKTGEECREVVAGLYNVKKSEYTWVTITAVPQFNKGENQPYQVFVTMHDITARKQSEDLLQKSEKEFRSTLNNLVAGVVVHASDTSILFSNAEATKLLGLTQDQIFGKEVIDPAWNFVHEDFSVMHFDEYPVKLVLSTKKPIQDSVFGIKKPDRKDITWVLVNAMPLFTNEGEVEKVIVNFIDYTDRKQAAEKERVSKAFLDKIINNIGDPVFVKDDQHKLLIVNDAFCSIFGMPRGEIIGRTLAEDVPPEEQDHFLAIDRQVLTDGKENACEETLTIKESKTLTILTKKTRYVDENDAKFLIGVIRDITERKEAENALQQSESAVRNKLKAIIEPEGNIDTLELSDIIDAEILQSMMEDFYQLTGMLGAVLDVSGKVLVAVGWQDICTKFHRCHPDTLQNCIESDTVLTNGVVPGTFKTYRCKNNMWDMVTPIMLGDRHVGNVFIGQFFYESEMPDVELFRKQARRYGFNETKYLAALDKVPHFSRETVNLGMQFYAKLARVISTLSYSTIQQSRILAEYKREKEEKEKLETRLIQSQKMESIGTLAGGIAHDFNNILFPILGYAEMILEDTPEGSPLRENVNEILNGALRAKDLVKQILTFSRQEDQAFKLLKIPPIIEEAMLLIRSTIPTSIKISQNIRKDCGVIKADPTQIHQIVMNLATNAYHAMESSGGELTVNLKEIAFGEQDVIGLDIEPGSYACLTVADTGVGMTQFTKEKAFEPFFTTKEQGKGTGLGLSVIHGIVKNAGGGINVYSEPGKGTEFNVYLPVVKSSLEQHEPEAIDLIDGGTEQILIVDDEKSILKMEKQILERLGYTVVSCDSSLNALETFRATPDEFDMVITDMTMPNMSGDKLAVELIKLRPDIPILLCTGFSERASEQQYLSMGIKSFLMKPIVKADLSRKIREILDN